MKSRLITPLRLALALLVVAVVAEAAIVAGGMVYSKRYSTALLSDPVPTAKPTTRLALGRKLKVDEVRGIWLHVSDGPTAGWVFKGDISDMKPVEIKGLDGLPIAASETTATAAARPLTSAAVDYAGRRSLTSSIADVDWLSEKCHAISDEDLKVFLQEKKKGEYQ